MSNCFCCKHRGALINQGIHWCDLQVEGYPDKEDCEYYDEIEISVTLTSTSSTVDMKKTCNECMDEYNKRGYY